MLATRNPNSDNGISNGPAVKVSDDTLETPLFVNAVKLPSRGPTPYVSTLRDSALILCPGGDDFETFRFWEALAAGAIPVTVKPKDPDIDFISHLGAFPSINETWAVHSACPFPVLESWQELPALMEHLFSDIDMPIDSKIYGEVSVSVIDSLQLQLTTCFQNLRSGVRDDLRKSIESLFTRDLIETNGVAETG